MEQYFLNAEERKEGKEGRRKEGREEGRKEVKRETVNLILKLSILHCHSLSFIKFFAVECIEANPTDLDNRA